MSTTLSIQRLDARTADVSAALQALRQKLSPAGNVVSEAGRRRTIDVGDPVVLVVAENRYLAEDACELVEVDYEELPAVMTSDAAQDPSSPAIFEDLEGGNVLVRSPAATFGDVDGAFARADAPTAPPPASAIPATTVVAVAAVTTFFRLITPPWWWCCCFRAVPAGSRRTGCRA